MGQADEDDDDEDDEHKGCKLTVCGIAHGPRDGGGLGSRVGGQVELKATRGRPLERRDCVRATLAMRLLRVALAPVAHITCMAMHKSKLGKEPAAVMWPVPHANALFRTGRLPAWGTRGRGWLFMNGGAVSEGNALQQHLGRLFLARRRRARVRREDLCRQGTPVTTLPDCILYQAFSKTNVPPTDCTDCTGLPQKVALSFPASWGCQAGGQGCPVILGWLGCDHPKRKKKKGAPCPVACSHNLALNEPPNASAKQVRTGHRGRENNWHMATRERRLTRIQVRGVAPAPDLLCSARSCGFGCI